MIIIVTVAPSAKVKTSSVPRIKFITVPWRLRWLVTLLLSYCPLLNILV